MKHADVFKKLNQYDVVTFDVFDTLITRSVLRPTDVFTLVEAAAKERGLTERAYASDRCCAEQSANARHGEGVTHQQIYEFLKKDFGYSQTQCGQLMELELEMELQVVLPRRDVQELFFQIAATDKKIVLCSDMYLNSGVIRQLLVKCGYPENLDIWVSSEKGAAKYSGKLWEAFFETLPAGCKTIHIANDENTDYRILRKMGRDAIHIDSGLDRFEKSPMYGYLERFADQGAANTLVLGKLINEACFNAAFDDTPPDMNVVSVWGGAMFACFMDYLVKMDDQSQLLFVTREGYLLKDMFERYSRCLGMEREGTLFYASRAATVAATITSAEAIRDSMKKPEFRGTLGEFAKSRLNYDLSQAQDICNLEISLPEQTNRVMQLLKPCFEEIISNGIRQNSAYMQYISQIRQPGKPLTVVDVGYNGTIQYALSKILSEKVGGLYMFLSDGAVPKTIGCRCDGMENPREGIHPVYDNLLFLEAVMQVPYGQLQRMELKDGEVAPVFNEDANFSVDIASAQEQFCRFTQWMAKWKKTLGDHLNMDFALAETIWVCLLKFDLLPDALIDSFWLSDDYSGYSVLRYNKDKQEWISRRKTIPLIFAVLSKDEKLTFKQKLKRYVKRKIPYFAYDWASKIWIKYIK